MVENKCLYNILQRNPTISISTPEQTFLARAMCFSKPAVSNSNIVLKVVEKYNFDGLRVYKCDETGAQIVQKS